MRYMVRCGTVMTSSVCRPVIEVQPVDNDLNPLGKIETIDLMDFL